MMRDQNFWKGVAKEGAVLNPVDRVSEVLFGLIMVLTFTGAISVATDGRQEIRELLWAALGCNVAWGLVDAIMYLMNIVLERGHSLTVIKRITKSKTQEASRLILKEEIQPLVAALLTDEELDRVSDRLKGVPEPSNKHLLTGTDLFAGLQIFLLVFLCTLPVALPFAFFKDVGAAIRASNGVALLLLFIGGYMLAGYAGFSRLTTASIYVIIGVLLVALTMALGG
jgi:VIT1/CCC1 family predicted Fe2+/Mn2+ transporter